MTGAFPAPSFHHVGLTVSDIDSALRFWRDGLGLKETRRFESDEQALADVVSEPGAHVVGVQLAFEGSPFRLDLYQYLAPAGGRHVARPAEVGASHVAVALSSLEAVVERLLEHGGTAVGERRALGGIECIYLRDPDGHVLELQEGTRSPAG